MIRILSCAVFLCAVVQISNVFADISYRTVALSGQPLPGGTGELFGNFTNMTLNNQDQTLISARLAAGIAGVSDADDSVLVSEGSGFLELLAREGRQAPGLSAGVNFSGNFSGALINEMGRTAFRAEVSGIGVSASNNEGIWTDAHGALVPLAREGDPAPGASNAVFGPLVTPHINDSGIVTFTGSLAGGAININNNEGVWVARNGALTLVAREGEQAPGVPTGVLFGGSNLDLINFSFSQTDDAGRIVFSAHLTSQTGTAGVWSERSGSLQLILRSDTQAPGTPAGTRFFTFGGAPEVNGAGQIADQWILTGGDVTGIFENAIGIWSEGNGPLALVARGGQQAPGTPSNVSFSFLSPPSFNDSGKSAFFANLRGTNSELTPQNNEGMWSDGFGVLALLAREGSPAPDSPSGAIFESFDRFAYRPQLNNRGQTAFAGKLRQGPGGVTADNDGAMWAQDLTGRLRLIVREGDPVTLAPGDVRTISEIGVMTSLGGDARTFRFNDNGTLAFILNFTDGSQGFFTATVPVPEPLGISLLAPFLVIVFDSNRNRYRRPDNSMRHP